MAVPVACRELCEEVLPLSLKHKDQSMSDVVFAHLSAAAFGNLTLDSHAVLPVASPTSMWQRR